MANKRIGQFEQKQSDSTRHLVALGICWTRGLEGVSLRWHDQKNPSNLYAKTDKAPPRKSANPWIFADLLKA